MTKPTPLSDAQRDEFIAAVVFGYLEMHDYHEVGQCQWCLWIPGSDWRGPHDCDASRFAKDPRVLAAWERIKELDDAD